MASIILISGAWYGSWCWEQIIPALEREGHRVLAPDLPGTSGVTTPVSAPSLDRWAEYVVGLVEQLPEPVILVGHSRAGMIICAVAERVPDRLARIVYLCALLLQDGESAKTHFADLIQSQGDAFVLRDDGGLAIQPGFARQILFNTTDRIDADRAISRLVAEPVNIVSQEVRLSPDRFGSVPRAYIQCSEDRAIPLMSQKAMCARLPCEPILELACDHSPFLSAPDELTQHLLTLAGTQSILSPPSQFP